MMSAWRLVALFGGLLPLMGGLAAIINHASFVGEFAAIEQLRADVQRVAPLEAEAMMGRVAAVNQSIKSCQAYNRTWWADVFIPDEWDDIKPIEVKRPVETQ